MNEMMYIVNAEEQSIEGAPEVVIIIPETIVVDYGVLLYFSIGAWKNAILQAHEERDFNSLQILTNNVLIKGVPLTSAGHANLRAEVTRLVGFEVPSFFNTFS